MTPQRHPPPAMPGEHTVGDILQAIRWANLTLTFRAEEPLWLPPYTGSTFRGAFGHAFKRVACPLRRQCEACAHQAVCVYAYVFETPGASDGSSLARGTAVAHPFVLDPPRGGADMIPPGTDLVLGLTLIGRAIPLAPYFLAACREMGAQGLGRERGRCRLVRATAEDPDDPKGRVVYDGAADLFAPAVPVWSAAELTQGGRGAGAQRSKEGGRERVTLEFLTPTRLRQEADLVVRPEFATLATALLRRVSVLAEVHCGRRAKINAKQVLASAADVKTEKSDLRWHDWERYSARQDARMTLGGFVGRITFAGPLGPWWPLFEVGEVLHAGKGTAFGLGKYRIEARGAGGDTRP